MAIITIRVCDNCGVQVEETRNRYTICLKTGNFLDGAGSRDYNVIDLEFCKNCAENICQSLEKIAESKQIN